MLKDLRFTLRNMGRSPGLAVVIAASLALGIGANTAIFSLIRAVMMKSLPVPDPDRLVLMHWHGEVWPKGLNQSGSGGPNNPAYKAASRSLPFPFFRTLRDGTSDVFDAVFAFAPLGVDRQNTSLAVDGTAERIDGDMVSGDYFRGLGVTPAAGRLITASDERGAVHAAVISYAYWNRRFGADPGIVGRDVTINHVPFTIVGVTPSGFFGVQPGRRPDVWVPMMDDAALVPWGYHPPDASLLDARGYWWTMVMGRLKPGVDERAARTRADGLFQQFMPDALPEFDRTKPPHIGFESGGGGLDTLKTAYEQPLRLLMAMVMLVLLIACANVAVLLLSRAMSRRREFALRLSLGAGRGRLIRQLLTESLLMAAAGGALGLLCAGWTSRGLMLLVPEAQRPVLDSSLDGSTLAFAAAVSIATAVLFGLAPAILSTRTDLLPEMKQSGSGTVASEHPAQKFWSSGFVVVQIALSLVLLVGAALFVRTLTNLEHQSLGVDDRHVLVFGLDASQEGYTGARLVTLYEEIVKRLAALPGAQSASASRLRLFSGWVSNGTIRVPGKELKPTSNSLNTNSVAPDFLATNGMRLLAGRDLTWADVEGKRRVAVVTEEAARYFFGTLNVVGLQYCAGMACDPSNNYEIVGVASNARYSQVRGSFPRTAYIPYTARENLLHGLYFDVRAAGDPLALGPSIRSAVASIDPTLAIVEMDSMHHEIGDSLWQERLFARLTSIFSALALLLACIGLYGTISYGVGRRRSEIAVRMALGARHTQVLWMILRKAVLLALGGVLAGVLLSIWVGKYLSSMLFGLSPRDPVTFAATAVVLVAIASLAGYFPARRAALVDPARALKSD